MYLFISHLFDSETHSFVCSICELCVNICKHCVCGEGHLSCVLQCDEVMFCKLKLSHTPDILTSRKRRSLFLSLSQYMFFKKNLKHHHRFWMAL